MKTNLALAISALLIGTTFLMSGAAALPNDDGRNAELIIIKRCTKDSWTDDSNCVGVRQDNGSTCVGGWAEDANGNVKDWREKTCVR